jgi:purine catabolism regulator
VLTVRELLSDLELSALTGAEALDQPVRWVHISELPDPTPWLSGGELLLTTGMQLDAPDRQRAFVERLADHHLAGVGLGTGFAHPAVPEAMREAAAARRFPLFEVPYELPFIALTEKAFTRLVNEQYAVLRRSLAAQERLERLLLAERGLDALAGALATLVGGAVLVLDGRGEPLAQRTFRRPLPAEAVAALQGQVRARAAGGGEAAGFAPGEAEHAGRALALPVAAGGEPGPGERHRPQAWVVAVKDAGGLTEFDRLILHQAVTIVALELLRRRVAEDTERRLAGDVLSAVVAGELKGRELERRLEPFGLGDRVAALVLTRAAAAPGGRQAPLGVESALAAALREEAQPGLVATHGGLACALLPGGGDEEVFALAERLRSRVAAALGGIVRGGAGRARAPEAARQAFHEARCALEASALGATGSGNGAAAGARVATFRDLGSFQLLLSLQEDDALRLFCDSVLGPIEQAEGHYGDELIRSVEVFIEENGQWERAARRLFCHRHTLRYRIRRVQELTGRDLGSARDRIEFWLALRGRELVTPGAPVAAPRP